MAEYRNIGPEEYRDLEERILYEDNHLLVVCKRVGEITQGDKTGDECLTEAYKAFIAQRDAKPGKVFLGLPHRLDRPVSGICLHARHIRFVHPVRKEEMEVTAPVPDGWKGV